MGEDGRSRPRSGSWRGGISFLLTLVAVVVVGALGGYVLGRYVFDRFLQSGARSPAPVASAPADTRPEPVNPPAGDTGAAPPVASGPSAAVEPAATPGALPSAGGAFFVQVGAFGSRERATAMVERMQREGFAATIQSQPGNPVLYKVMVGPYPRRDDAAQALQRIRASVPDAFIP